MNETIHDRIKHLVEKCASGKNTAFATKLGVSEANIRGYIKNVVPKADILEKIVISYDVNAIWLLTGMGDMLQGTPEVPPAASDATIDRLLAKITEQAEQIGALKEQIKQLQREKGKDVPDAQTSVIANVG